MFLHKTPLIAEEDNSDLDDLSDIETKAEPDETKPRSPSPEIPLALQEEEKRGASAYYTYFKTEVICTECAGATRFNAPVTYQNHVFAKHPKIAYKLLLSICY